MDAYQDPNSEGNSARYRTGKPCIEPGCDEPAGTAWSPLWCVACNIKRLDRIDDALAPVAKALGIDDGYSR